MGLRLFVTGGTFDKEYNEIKGELYFRTTHIPEMLRLGRCELEVEIETLMMIDSLDMNDGHRRLIVERCQMCSDPSIVITHGTDTLEVTARALGAAKIEKTIVLTGAMVPYKFGSSDGLFNLGSALALAQVLPHGVYVAMNGRWFNWDRVRKDRARGVFVDAGDDQGEP